MPIGKNILLHKQELIQKNFIKTEAQFKTLQEYLSTHFVRKYVKDDAKTARNKRRYTSVVVDT